MLEEFIGESKLWAAVRKAFLKERDSELGLEGQEALKRQRGKGRDLPHGSQGARCPGTWGSAILWLRKAPRGPV